MKGETTRKNYQKRSLFGTLDIYFGSSRQKFTRRLGGNGRGRGGGRQRTGGRQQAAKGGFWEEPPGKASKVLRLSLEKIHLGRAMGPPLA